MRVAVDEQDCGVGCCCQTHMVRTLCVEMISSLRLQPDLLGSWCGSESHRICMKQIFEFNLKRPNDTPKAHLTDTELLVGHCQALQLLLE